jgi:archaellum biogenesis protein FlaJ (TadC family)
MEWTTRRIVAVAGAAQLFVAIAILSFAIRNLGAASAEPFLYVGVVSGLVVGVLASRLPVGYDWREMRYTTDEVAGYAGLAATLSTIAFIVAVTLGIFLWQASRGPVFFQFVLANNIMLGFVYALLSGAVGGLSGAAVFWLANATARAAPVEPAGR